jgi:hypothetical protein
VATKLPNSVLVGGLALVAFVAALGVSLFRNGGLQELDRRGHSELEHKVGVQLDGRGGHSGASTSVDLSVARNAVPASSVPSTAHPLSQSRGDAREVEREGARSDNIVEAERPYLGVVGRPFPLSPSMEAECRVDEEGCALALRLLKQFSQQPRDPAWASKMEAGLRELVMSRPGYSIRAIECRVSLCAAEVASSLGMFNFIASTGPYGSDLSLRSLSTVYGETAYEHNPTYATVTLMTFERWPP